VRIELLLNDSLRPRLLARRLMLRLKLNLAGLADSDDRNILYSPDDSKVALGHSYSLPQFDDQGFLCDLCGISLRTLRLKALIFSEQSEARSYRKARKEIPQRSQRETRIDALGNALQSYPLARKMPLW
jgi:hypothetical protein